MRCTAGFPWKRCSDSQNSVSWQRKAAWRHQNCLRYLADNRSARWKAYYQFGTHKEYILRQKDKHYFSPTTSYHAFAVSMMYIFASLGFFWRHSHNAPSVIWRYKFVCTDRTACMDSAHMGNFISLKWLFTDTQGDLFVAVSNAALRLLEQRISTDLVMARTSILGRHSGGMF